MKAFVSLFAVFIALSCSHHYAAALQSDLCRVLADGTKFRRPNTCNEYVECQNQTTATFHTCVNPLMFYDQKKFQCVETASVCDRNYCEGVKNGQWVDNPNNCNGFFYCSNGKAEEGYCEMGFHFDVKKQSCIYEATSKCFEVSNICAFLPDQTKVRNEENCAKYFLCSKGKKIEMNCEKNTYFDVEKQNCFNKTLTPCKAHPSSGVCSKSTGGPFSGFTNDGATCRGYFYCKDLGSVPDKYPTWGQCPEGLFFDSKTQTCKAPTEVVCTNNRCDGRGTMFVSSNGKNCREYIVCENSIPVDIRTCAHDRFFDEALQSCVDYIISYKCCAGQK